MLLLLLLPATEAALRQGGGGGGCGCWCCAALVRLAGAAAARWYVAGVEAGAAAAAAQAAQAAQAARAARADRADRADRAGGGKGAPCWWAARMLIGEACLLTGCFVCAWGCCYSARGLVLVRPPGAVAVARAQAAAPQASEVDEVIKRVLAIENVSRYVVYNREGVVLRYEGWPASEPDGGYKKCVQLAGTLSTLVHHCSQQCQELLAPPHVRDRCFRCLPCASCSDRPAPPRPAPLRSPAWSRVAQNDVECLRLKTKQYEMIIAPGASFTMVAFQENQKKKEAQASA